MNEYDALGRVGLRGALEVRKRAGVTAVQPVCVYDMAEHLGLEVRFCPFSSLGGMYAKPLNVILVPAGHQPGRQSFTCAHEVAHWFFGHGTRLDSLADIGLRRKHGREERLANIFAGYLLLPPRAIKLAFASRNIDPATCSLLDLYRISLQFGVGYSTLATHLRWSLGAISLSRMNDVLQVTPQKLRVSLLGRDPQRRLVIVDRQWSYVPIDLQVEELVLLPQGATIEGNTLTHTVRHDLGDLYLATRPGISRATTASEDWAAFIRVSRLNFHGRSVFRHLEDPDGVPSP